MLSLPVFGPIIANLACELRRRFDDTGSPCRVFTETFCLLNTANASSLLPDILVTCHRLPRRAASVEDPTVVVEVLSEGTSKRDRNEKWSVYRSLPSLRHGVLIARDTAHVEIFDRLGDGWSHARIVEGIDASFDFPAIEASIALSRIYRDVLL